MHSLQNKIVLIKGGTGSLGSRLVEKLLFEHTPSITRIMGAINVIEEKCNDYFILFSNKQHASKKKYMEEKCNTKKITQTFVYATILIRFFI